MNNSIKAKVRWSKSVKIITWVTSIIFILGILGIGYALYAEGFNWIGVTLLPVIILTFIGSLLVAPISIRIDDNYITITRLMGSKKIKRSDLINVYSFQNNGYNVRLFGSGGFFGFLGTFTNKNEGRYTSYVCDYNQAFYLILKSGKKYLLSCEHRDLIVSMIKEKL